MQDGICTRCSQALYDRSVRTISDVRSLFLCGIPCRQKTSTKRQWFSVFHSSSCSPPKKTRLHRSNLCILSISEYCVFCISLSRAVLNLAQTDDTLFYNSFYIKLTLTCLPSAPAMRSSVSVEGMVLPFSIRLRLHCFMPLR